MHCLTNQGESKYNLYKSTTMHYKSWFSRSANASVCASERAFNYIFTITMCSKQSCSKRTLIHYRKHRQNTKGNLAKYIIFFGKKSNNNFFKPSKAAVLTRYAVKTEINYHDRYFWCIIHHNTFLDLYLLLK